MPPEGMSPAAMRFNLRMKYDTKTFIVAMVGMAVKGFMTISDNDGYTLKRTPFSGSEADLSSEERAIAALLAKRDTIEIRNSNHAEISSAIAKFTHSLKSENQDVYFAKNSGWSAGGLAFVVGTIIAIVGVVVWTRIPPNPLVIPVVFGQVVLTIASVFFLKARTSAGMKLRRSIEGFRLFLTSTGTISKETFEEFLPYAMALDVEEAWNRRFAGAHTDLKVPEDFYQPDWFAGTHYPLMGGYGFSDGMITQVNSAAVDPSAGANSGGYDGGGGAAAGGGGGGGGGGGW
jgi:uncharacterized membrane protein YgcG